MKASAAPASLGELFWAFNRLALQGFGGVLAVAQRELVERLGWLSREEFLDTFAIAQVLPGPNIVNISLMLGDRFFGTRGAFAALAGMLLFPAIIVIGMAALYGQFASHPVVANALRGMGAVSAGLILATGLKLLPSLKRSPMGRLPAILLALLTIIAVLWLRLPLPQLLLGLGGLGMALAWWQMRRATKVTP
ncbi:chromate transporter [Roseateles oligotrophus]|uniref:Chromate transporter n=1 Tax=Roseateles oligotrophus TaxID=1769250 RepID=A0ABT2YMD2_9BURK|nr:chromate transporter [Roseateles oligotrophus]MCV2371204.1 chromate transporter [Roseateles oligotrophus]